MTSAINAMNVNPKWVSISPVKYYYSVMNVKRWGAKSADNK